MLKTKTFLIKIPFKIEHNVNNNVSMQVTNLKQIYFAQIFLH